MVHIGRDWIGLHNINRMMHRSGGILMSTGGVGNSPIDQTPINRLLSGLTLLVCLKGAPYPAHA